MGGSSALTLAAYHHDQFKFAGSLSGFPDISAPGMRIAMRVAMLDAGRFNVDAMWGPPWSEGWNRNDPFHFAGLLRGISLFISAGNGVPQAGDVAMGGSNLANAIGLETLSDIETHAFQIKMMSLGIPATYDYTWDGVHSWSYWQFELVESPPADSRCPERPLTVLGAVRPRRFSCAGPAGSVPAALSHNSHTSHFRPACRTPKPMVSEYKRTMRRAFRSSRIPHRGGDGGRLGVTARGRAAVAAAAGRSSRAHVGGRDHGCLGGQGGLADQPSGRAVGQLAVHGCAGAGATAARARLEHPPGRRASRR